MFIAIEQRNNKMELQIGTIVKSYDFPGITDCYIIGRVVNIEEDMLSCEVIKQVSCGKEKVGHKTFRTPMQGAMMMDDKFERVVVIG